jgi:DNA-directed RNA polymerase specialized sigma24 family protein
MTEDGIRESDKQIANEKQRIQSTVVSLSGQPSALETAISRLSDEFREAILLRHRDNLTFAEIGLRLRTTEDAARQIWARAVQCLQQELPHESTD